MTRARSAGACGPADAALLAELGYTPPPAAPAPAPRLVPLRVFVRYAGQVQRAADVMAPHDASEADVFAQAVRKLLGNEYLGRALPVPSSVDGWQLDRVELGHERR